MDLFCCLQQQMLSSRLCQNPPGLPSVGRLSASRNQQQDMQKSLHFPKVLTLLFCWSHQVSNPQLPGRQARELCKRWELQSAHEGAWEAAALSDGGLGAGLGNHRPVCSAATLQNR